MAQLYGIDGIPAIWVIDPEGKILAQGLKGKELVAFVPDYSQISDYWVVSKYSRMKKIIILLLLVCPVLMLRADEGMWLLSRLKQHNEAQMKNWD